MSTLQCPATLLLAAPGATADSIGTTPARRVTHVWAPPDGEAEAGRLAERLQVGATVHPELEATGVAGWREALAGIADQSPGETTVVLALGDGLRAALPCLASTDLGDVELGAAVVLELAVDADGWALRRG